MYLPTNKQLLKVFTCKQSTTKGIYLQTSNYKRYLPTHKQLLKVFTYKKATTKGFYLQTSNY